MAKNLCNLWLIFRAFLWLKNRFNQRNPRLINHLFTLGNELRQVVLNLGNLDFDIVSYFDIRISYFAGIGISTSVENSLQISSLIMQNEPNFGKAQMNVCPDITKDYEKRTLGESGKNEPKTNPIKANFRKAQMNVNSVITKDYRKNDDFAVRKNKPNSNPISVKPKMSATSLYTVDYENKRLLRRGENKPNQTQLKPISKAKKC